MAEPQTSESISPRLQRIAELAREAPGLAFRSLAHHIDVDLLREAYRRTRKGGAPGVDGVSGDEYAHRLEDNLRALLDHAKAGTYRAPPVRRVHIPKGDGHSTRPLGIPTFEDKVLQRAVAMVLEAVYEQDFCDFSYGFRPKRSAHQALEALREAMMSMQGGWIVEVDVRKYFDTVDHAKLLELIRQRVRDGVLLRLIGKWLNAGVLEEERVHYSEAGTPQGGVISPLLANIYLHTVVDLWFVRDVLPRLRGRAAMVRYADDMVLVFELEEDARRVFEVLPKRFEKYGLSLHPDKTRLLDCRRPPSSSKDDEGGPGSFDFLGFTHHWARSRKGNWVVKRRTAADRFRRTLRRLHDYCRDHRHEPVQAQQRALSQRLRGHYAYFGVPANLAALTRIYRATRAAWRRWLDARSHRARMTWARFCELLARLPLPVPRIAARYTS
jgi:RNA-directed DNA polymerase